MKLILVRHGETEGNVRGIMQGHLPGKLTKKGIEQAKKLALRLKDEKINAIYSSDLKRASDTAKEIAEYHKNVPLKFVKELREGDIGSFSGKKAEEIKGKPYPDDAENLKDMRKRAKIFLDKVYEKHKNHTILLISHGRISEVLITIILNKPLNYLEELGHLKNTSVNIFEIKEDKKHKVHLLNCTKHLE
ncbi:histidine phosphatase family protein [Candidatus Woesearchaeota archaeon]|nr:histidine phosphatase family protein [Candidatus Woesearchaeota archaeon]